MGLDLCGDRVGRKRDVGNFSQGRYAGMKSHTEYLTFNLPRRVGFERITEQVQRIVTESGVREGLALVNAKRI